MADQQLTLGTLFTGQVDATFRKATRDLKTLLDRLHGASVGATAGMAGAGRATSKTKDEMTQMNRQLSRVSGGFQRLTAAAKVTAAYGLASMAIFGLINALKKGTTVIVEYDQALKNLQAITQSTAAETAAMSVSIKRVAATTKYSTQEVAEAAIILGQAGFSAAETIASIEAVANLATGTLSDMSKVTDLMTTAIRAFGLEASDSTRIADIFANVVNNSKATIDKLRTSFNYLGPIARLAGLSLEEVGAGAMVLYNAGLRASTVGTGFRQVLSRLVNPSEKLRLTIKATGANIEKLNPATATFVEIIGELEKILGKTIPKTIASQRAFQMFGLRGAAPAAAFAQAGVKGIQEMLTEVEKSGSAAKMAQIQMEGLGVMAKNLRDKIELLAVSIGEGGIAGAFAVFLRIARPMVDLFIRMSETIEGKLVVAITSLTIVILALSIAFKYLAVVLFAATSGIGIAGVKSALAAGKITLLGAAFKGLIGIASKLWMVLMNHPFLRMVILISGVSAALLTYIRHEKQAQEKIEQTVVSLDSEIASLEKYQDRLAKTNTDKEAHSNVMERLIQQYPELAGEIDIVTGKLKDEGEALQKLIDKKKEEKLLNLTELSEAALAKRKKHLGYLEAAKVMAEAYGRTTKKWRKNFRENTKIVEESEKEFLKYIGGIAEGIRMWNITSTSDIQDISTVLRVNLGISIDHLEMYAKAVQKYYGEVESAHEKALREQMTLRKEQEDFLRAAGGEWLKLFGDLEGQLGKKLALLKFLKKVQKDITDMAKAARAMGADPGEIEALRTELYDRAFKTFTRKQGEMAEKQKEIYESMERDLLKFAGKLQEADEKDALRERNKRDVKIRLGEDEEQRKKSLLKSEEVYQAQLISIDKKYIEKRMRLYEAITDTVGKTLDDREVKELAAVDKKYRRLRMRVYAGEIKNAEEAHDFVIKSLKNQEDDKLSITEAFALLRIAAEEKAAAKIVAAQEAVLKAIEDARKVDKRRVKALYKNADDFLKMGVVTAEEYSDILEEAYLHDLLTYEEMIQKKVIASGTWLEQLKFGLSDSVIKAKTWGDTLVEIGQEVGDRLATNLTSGLMDFIDGTKDAGEAFEDFAKKTINWIMEMIIKQIMLNAVMGIVSKFTTPSYDPATAGGEGFVPGVTDRAYAGGGWINEPVVGRGIRTGQTYSFAEKRPEYVDSGRSSGQGVKVELINKSGTELKASEAEARFDGRELIVTTVIDAYDRNAYGMRDIFGGRR